MRTAFAFAMAVSAISLHPTIASADITKAQCLDASGNGQSLRKQGKLTAAKEQFQICNDAKCPEIVRTDCTQRLDEIQAAIPSIVFDVKKNGADAADVKITVDGTVVAPKYDGKAMTLDPGSHEFKFEIPGEKEQVQTFVLKEGEKTREEHIAFGAAPPAPTPPPVAPVTAPAVDNSQTAQLMRFGGLGLGAAGVVALGAGILYGIKASSKWDDQQKDCASAASCKNHPQALSDHDGAVVWGRFSTIGFVAAGVLIAAGATLFLLAPSDSAKTGKLSDPLGFTF